MENAQMSMTIIPKKKNLFIMEDGTIKKKKVAAYARVSTDLEDQKNSFNAQLEEYGKRISENPEWEFVKLYSDEGISGTSLKHREGFKEMIADALAGKIDLILTKSISRFARNTVDCIKTYRDLRAANVGIYFDKEHINSLEKDVEFQLTLYASMAQEESKTISGNVKWGVRSRMKRGDRKMNIKYTLGYKYDENGKIVIDEEEATTVKSIFEWFIGGYSGTEIASILNNNHLKRNGTKDWQYLDVFRILRDEKYIGMFVMQKTVVKDFLDHKAYKNDGIEDKIIMNNHHEEIVTKDNFDYVQIVLQNQKSNPSMQSERKDLNPLNGLVFCGCCGLPLVKIKTHPGATSERLVLTCRNVNKTSVLYRNCTYQNEVTDYKLALEATYSIYEKFTGKCRVSASNFLQNVNISISELMNEKNAVDKEISMIQNDLQEILTKAITTNSKTNEGEFNKANRKLNDLKGKLERIINSIKELRELTIDLNHIEWLLKNKEENKPTNRLIKKVIKMVIRKNDGSLRFIVSKDDIGQSDIDSLLLLEPTYSSEVKDKKRILKYDVVVKGGKHEN